MRFRVLGSHHLRLAVPGDLPLTHDFVAPSWSGSSTVAPHDPISATPAGYHAKIVWAIPVSLATTKGMISTPRGTEMFQFPRCPPRTLWIQVRVIRDQPDRVPPFGYLGIDACYQLPRAFRR
jgi:hypothetical protein